MSTTQTTSPRRSRKVAQKPKLCARLDAKLQRIDLNLLRGMKSQERLQAMIDKHQHDPDVKPEHVALWKKIYAESAAALASDAAQLAAAKEKRNARWPAWPYEIEAIAA